MAKSDLFSNSLIPIALVAAILSGASWRGTPPADTGKPGDSGTNPDKSDGASAPAKWISDLRPVLETLDGALGARAGSEGVSPLAGAASVPLETKGDPRDQQIQEAMVDLRKGLDRLSSPVEPATCVDGEALQQHANVLAAEMFADDGGEGKTRAAEARALLDEFRDWRLFADLIAVAKTSGEGSGHPDYSISFIVATIPDYVDSNSGWMADQALASTQSAMAQEQYLFDRVRLVDWSRGSTGPVTILSGSRLHERQPGALIFRKVEGRNISVQVVLTVSRHRPPASTRSRSATVSGSCARGTRAAAPRTHRCGFWARSSPGRLCR